MMKINRVFGVLLCALLWLVSPLSASDYRELTSVEGQVIEAKVTAVLEGDLVNIEMRNGKAFKEVSFQRFSASDQDYFRTWLAKREAAKDDALLTVDSKIKVFVKSSRDNDLNEKGDPDNREVEYEPALTFDNEEKDLSFKNVEGTLIFIGESVLQNREMHVLYKQDFVLDLPADARTRWEGRPFTNVYDDYARNGSAFGAKYEGYLLILRDKEGKVAIIKGSKSKWVQNYQKILNANKRKAYSSDFMESFPKTRV